MAEPPRRAVIHLPPGGGRRYAMGRLTAWFKADGEETGSGCSASEWLLEPGQPGVGAHHHAANDEIFLVLEGRVEFLLGDAWTPCEPGAFLRIPAGVVHDFRDSGPAAARFFSMVPGDGFEHDMPTIVDWFS